MSLKSATIRVAGRSVREAIEEDGYALVPGVFSLAQVSAFRDGMGSVLKVWSHEPEVVRAQAGVVGGGMARNVLTLWPPAADVWRQAALVNVLADVLGPHFGLVRVLFFDKPPGQS